jgi:hypothetical protein
MSVSRHIQELEAVAAEHGGAVCFRVLPGEEMLLGVLLRILYDPGDPLATLVISGDDEIAEVRALVRIEDLNRLVKGMT